MSKTSFAKLRDGSWGLRGNGLQEGARVMVSKRDGSARHVTVGRIVWSGADGMALATIAQEDRETRDSEPEARPARSAAPAWAQSAPAANDTPPAWDVPPAVR